MVYDYILIILTLVCDFYFRIAKVLTQSWRIVWWRPYPSGPMNARLILVREQIFYWADKWYSICAQTHPISNRIPVITPFICEFFRPCASRTSIAEGVRSLWQNSCYTHAQNKYAWKWEEKNYCNSNLIEWKTSSIGKSFN